jgi:hypothetical protein
MSIDGTRRSLELGQTKMEIGPVTNVRIVPMVKSRETDLGMTDVDDVERLSRVGDETYTPSNAKGGTGFEDDVDDRYEEEDIDDPKADEEGVVAKFTGSTGKKGQIDCVA